MANSFFKGTGAIFVVINQICSECPETHFGFGIFEI